MHTMPYVLLIGFPFNSRFPEEEWRRIGAAYKITFFINFSSICKKKLITDDVKKYITYGAVSSDSLKFFNLLNAFMGLDSK